MCGIVGYIGPRDAAPILLEGLARLEYRGYDSAGIALVTASGELFVEKRAGKLSNLRTALLDATPAAAVGLAHTRWATHGRPNDLNAHPHVDCTGDVTVIHNGIIENFRDLRDGLLARGHRVRLRDRHRGARAPRGGGVRGRHRGCRAVGAAPGRWRLRGRGAPPRASPTGSWARATTCPSSWASARARTCSPRTSRPCSATPAGSSSSRRVTSPTCAPRRCVITGLDGVAARAAGAPHRLVHRGGREGRLRALHAQGDARAAGGHRARPSPAGSTSDEIRLDELEPVMDAIARRGAHRAHRVRQRGLCLGHRGPPARGVGGPAGPLEHRLRVPLQPAAARRADAGHRGHPVGRDRRHPRAGAPGPRARAAPSSRSPTPSARPSPARRTRCCSSRRGPRSRSWRPRRS